MSKRHWFFIGILVVVAAAIVAFVVMKNTKSPQAVSGPIKTINTQSNKSEDATSSTATTATGSSKVVAADNQVTSSGGPMAPYGSLVSNHKPGQNGSNLTELSQCTTTSGAACYIKFTQNGIVKTLPTQTVDSSGATYWEWKVNDAGLTTGNWTITAVATLNGQTKTTTDRLPLEVQ